jgi:uncharacterized protein
MTFAKKSVAVLLGFVGVASIGISSAAQAEPAMWVIHDNDSTIYVIGTVHLLRHEAEWTSKKVKDALAESTELWLEVPNPDNASAAAQLIQQYGIDREKPLSQKLNFIERQKMSKLAADYHIPAAGLEMLKPWTAALFFAILPLQKAGYDPNSGVDSFLEMEARKKGEKIQGFETLEEQIQFFDELPEKEQIAFLDDTFDEVEEGIARLERMAVAWMKGDTKSIDDLLVQEMKNKYPTFYEKFLVQRNIHWAGKIEEMLHRSGVQLIAVGIGHLVGSDSVPAQLAKRGIKVEAY